MMWHKKCDIYSIFKWCSVLKECKVCKHPHLCFFGALSSKEVTSCSSIMSSDMTKGSVNTLHQRWRHRKLLVSRPLPQQVDADPSHLVITCHRSLLHLGNKEKCKSCQNIPPWSTDCCLQIIPIMEEMAILQLPSVRPPPLPLRPPPPISVIRGSRNQRGIRYKVQGGITRIREKCQSTWKSFMYSDVVQEKEELENLREKEWNMEGVQLRSGAAVMSKEWARRLTDYQFLSGKDDQLPKRQTRSRRNQRATVIIPQITRRSSDPVCCCPVALFLICERSKVLRITELLPEPVVSM